MSGGFLQIFIALNTALGIQSEILTSPLVTNWGEWGTFENCPNGTFVIGFQLKTDPWRWFGLFYDDTCLNAIRFYCGDPKESIPGTLSDSNSSSSFNVTGNNNKTASAIAITSSEGDWGKWGKIYECDGEGYAIGFMLRSEEAGTPWLDETAANNFRILCSGSTNGYIAGDGERWGQWTSPRICQSNQYICGLQTQVQEYQGLFGDDTALNNIRVECCTKNPDEPGK